MLRLASCCDRTATIQPGRVTLTSVLVPRPLLLHTTRTGSRTHLHTGLHPMAPPDHQASAQHRRHTASVGCVSAVVMPALARGPGSACSCLMNKTTWSMQHLIPYGLQQLRQHSQHYPFATMPSTLCGTYSQRLAMFRQWSAALFWLSCAAASQ